MLHQHPITMLHYEIVQAAISLCGRRCYTFANTYTYTGSSFNCVKFHKVHAAMSLFRLNRGIKRSKYNLIKIEDCTYDFSMIKLIYQISNIYMYVYFSRRKYKFEKMRYIKNHYCVCKRKDRSTLLCISYLIL